MLNRYQSSCTLPNVLLSGIVYIITWSGDLMHLNTCTGKEGVLISLMCLVGWQETLGKIGKVEYTSWSAGWIYEIKRILCFLFDFHWYGMGLQNCGTVLIYNPQIDGSCSTKESTLVMIILQERAAMLNY